MSMIRPFAWLAMLVAIVGAAASAHAQHYQPFIDPGYFGQPEFQFFAPPEVSDFSGGEPPNTGIYGSFDRTYVNVSRPSDETSFNSEGQGDFTWGNRMEIGYMTEEKSGWQGVLWHVNGPNETFTNAEDVSTVPITIGGATLSTQILDPVAVGTINQFKMSSFELNKVWRRKEFHNGAVLEPLVGFRYINARDFFQRQEAAEIAILVPPLIRFRLTDTEKAMFENQLIGGQLGGRLFRQRGHWLLSGEVKFFAFGNFQTLAHTFENSILADPDSVPANGIAEIIGIDIGRSRIYERNTEFVWGGEIKGEAAYELTRDISLRFGFVFFDLGQGIGRGNLIELNNQSVQMAGLTFGFTINR
jgi:hypothetical protein